MKTAFWRGYHHCTEEVLEPYRIFWNCELLAYRGIRKTSLFPLFQLSSFAVSNLKYEGVLLNVIASVCIAYHLLNKCALNNKVAPLDNHDIWCDVRWISHSLLLQTRSNVCTYQILFCNTTVKMMALSLEWRLPKRMRPFSLCRIK